MKKEKTKGSFLSQVGGLGLAVLLALVLRSFTFEPYNIPSGSMFPTLLVGDHLFISKYAYGYSRHSFPFSLPLIPKGRIFEKKPKLGDVVVFRVTPELMPSAETSMDYIKRVVGLPGDTVQLKNGRLYINNQEVQREYIKTEKMEIEGKDVLYTRYLETLPNGVTHEIYEINDMMKSDDTEPVTVPEGYFFAMGDNRDNSYDSRFFGVVPLTHLEGRAEIIVYSNNGEGFF
jgi:signal peptidase I